MAHSQRAKLKVLEKLHNSNIIKAKWNANLHTPTVTTVTLKSTPSLPPNKAAPFLTTSNSKSPTPIPHITLNQSHNNTHIPHISSNPTSSIIPKTTPINSPLSNINSPTLMYWKTPSTKKPPWTSNTWFFKTIKSFKPSPKIIKDFNFISITSGASSN